MRWKRPRHESERTVTAFLWLPKRIGDETRWLERATWLERYDAEAYVMPGETCWIERAWVD